nr:hypothetical protein [Tanacetum cinerariifolium]
MHNNIMAAGSRDRPPMLTTRRYAQWQSRFMRNVDTKQKNVALKKCILQGSYVLSEIIIPAKDMWIAIERLQQELEAQYSFMEKIQEVLTADLGSYIKPLEKVQSDAEYNVFANERQHSEQPESINDTYVVEKDDNNVIPDSSNICDNVNQADQNAKECDEERDEHLDDIWREYTRLVLIWKRNGQDYNSTPFILKNCTLEHGDGVVGFKRRRQDFYGDIIMDLMTASGRSRLKLDLEESTWRRHRRLNMASLADKAILSGADNRPPMLEKDMYDSWKSRMELYILNRQHGRMILESVEHGPLLWPTVEEDGVTR